MLGSLTTLAIGPEMMGMGSNLTQTQIAAMAGILGIAIGLLIAFFIVIGLALYIYQSLAWYSIAKKLKHKRPWLAWIPVANFFLLPVLAKKDVRWGWIILLPFVLMPFILIPIVGPMIYFLGIIFVIIMAIVWTWDIFERRKFPGWLSLMPAFMFIPIVNFFAIIAHLIIIGLVAWKNRK